MTYIWLRRELATTIIQHALQEKPHEACGLIVGVQNEAHKAIPIPNIATDPRTRFEMDSTALSTHLPSLTKDGLLLLAFYHSHPNGSAIPSPSDIEDAAYPDVIHVLIGLKHPKPEIKAWQIHNWRVTPVKIYVGDDAPKMDEDLPLSKAQTVAIIISAIVAVALLIIMSMSLLPPAPPIPTP
jgi:proteasome lid subunit RPN8/RPN11